MELLKQAVEALQIDVPVLHWQVEGKVLRLYLYGGAIIEWTIPSPHEKKAKTR